MLQLSSVYSLCVYMGDVRQRNLTITGRSFFKSSLPTEMIYTNPSK